MNGISLRPAELDCDFGQLAGLFTLEQDEPTTEAALKAEYEEYKERIIQVMVAENAQRELLGFNWLTRKRDHPQQAYFYVIVKPEHRGQGVGRRLYQDVEKAARAGQIERLEVNIHDNCPACVNFARAQGFKEHNHWIGMTLNLASFDDQPYNETIARLQSEGFVFTSMEELGNTEAAQHQLYMLNDTNAADIPGAEGVHPWASFEDFQKHVCQADWYIPAGQKVVIDSATGSWAAMSAITRFAGVDYAYNLHTGVDRRYRGRKLAQAVKTLALRYAREVLRVSRVQTHHNARNAPIIAIDQKFGYVQTPGGYEMVKDLA